MADTPFPVLSDVAAMPKSTAVADLLALISNPNIISFAGGLPNPAGFPVKEAAEASAWVFETQGARALQYSQGDGVPELREAIAEFETANGVPTTPDQVMIVTGSQQALDLVARAFLDKNKKMLIESPTYLGALGSFNLCSPTYVEMPVDEYGMNPSVLGDECKDVSVAYVMPTFANPTGLTIDDSRRKLLAEKARQYDFWLIEDDPYGELWYDVKPCRSLRAYAPERTIHLGTLSKVLSPGLRLGYIIADPKVLKIFSDFKQAADLHSSTLTQLIAAKLLKSHLLDTHLPKVRTLYKTQCHAMLDALEEFMPKHPEVSWTHPTGGMFIWMHLPKNVDASDYFRDCVARNVAFVPSVAFYANEPELNHCRLSFVTVPVEKIREGVKIMAEELAKRL